MNNLSEEITEFQDNSNSLIYVLSKQDIECDIVWEAQEVIDEARSIIKQLLIEKAILSQDKVSYNYANINL